VGNQAGGAFASIPARQPFHLTPADTQSLNGTPRHQPFFDHGFYNLEPVQLAHRHGDSVRRSHCSLRRRRIDAG
jgi:hypothetical protein